MTITKQHLVTTSIYAAILALGVGLFALVHFSYQQTQQNLLDHHRANSTTKLRDVAAKVEGTINQIYQCVRTVARLPGVRELEPDGKNDPTFHGGDGIESNTLLSIQEIYNNLGSNVAVSELYIVPVDLDPDAPESNTQAVREPLATFDHLIVGQQGGAGASEDHGSTELEEIEIHEYRLMKKQLTWMKMRYPHEASFNALDYPMIGGPQVVTCDNSYYDPSAPDDQDRSGLVLSMPYYGPDGELRGCVSAVILTHVLKSLLPNGNYAISSDEYDYCISPHHDGQWQLSLEHACTALSDPDLLVSSSQRLDIQDKGGAWSLWLGLPDSDFWESPDVQTATESRDMAYGFVASLIIVVLCSTWLVRRGHKTILRINRGLEQSIREQTDDLELALGELKNQKFAMDQHAIVSVADIRGNISYANDKFCQLSDYTLDELVGQNHRVVKSDEHDHAFYRDLWKTISSGNVWHGEIKNKAKDGSHFWVDATIVPFKDEQGKITQYVAVRTDITERKESERRYKLAVNGSQDGLWDWDLVTDRVYYAPRWQQMLGLDLEDEIGDSPDEWISRIDERDVQTFMDELSEHLRGTTENFETEMRMAHKDGACRWMLCRGAVIRDNDGRAIRVAGSFADITDIKQAQADLKKLAEHDRLTELPNRELFQKKLQQAIELAAQDPEFRYAVLFFDFDRFKLINDSLGHNVGDALLVDIAGQFRANLRDRDVAARFGGDEFVVLLHGLKNPGDEHINAKRLLDLFAKPHRLYGHDVYSSASIGLVTSDQGYSLAEEVIRDADAAMYQAKEAGRGRFIEFDQKMHESAVDRVRLEGDLRFAIEHEEFRLVYQPIVNLESGALHGFEALVRWDHPKRGVVSPVDFIPIAEDTGLIVPIGEWVLREACQQVYQWDQTLKLDTPPSINVNLSLRQLCHPDTVDVIKSVLHNSQIDPSRLKLEITESTIVDDRYDMIPRLEEIKRLGIKLAMDDFGTGQSSLSNLHSLPVDVLKIDRSFVQSLTANRDLAAVMQAIIAVADNLGMQTVAEGIETAEQLVILQALGCEYAQGFYFKPPMTPQQAEQYMLGKDQAASA